MTTLQIDVDEHTRASVDYIYNTLGIDTATAVKMFFIASLSHDGFPFQVRLGAREPSAEFLETMEDVRLRRNLHGPFKTGKEAVRSMLEDE